MNATISAAERALIDAAIAEGKVTKVPLGANTQPQYTWCKGKDGIEGLHQVGGSDLSWRSVNAKRARAKLAAKGNDQSKRSDVIAAKMRRAELRPMIESGMSAPAIARATGHNVELIRSDAKKMKLTLTSAIPTTREEVLIAALANPGFGAPRLARVMGLPQTTVEVHMKRLRKEGRLPPVEKRDYLKRDPQIANLSCDTRDRVLSIAKSNPDATAADIAQNLGKSIKCVEKHVAKLRSEGLIPMRDKRGFLKQNAARQQVAAE